MMEQTEVITPEIVEFIPALNPQHEGYIALRQQGVKQTDAIRQVGLSTGYSTRLEKKYKKYLVSGDTKLLRLAHTNLKSMLQPDSQIKDSVRLGCIQTVLDRNDPVIRHSLNENINVHVTPVDIERWRR